MARLDGGEMTRRWQKRRQGCSAATGCSAFEGSAAVAGPTVALRVAASHLAAQVDGRPWLRGARGFRALVDVALAAA